MPDEIPLTTKRMELMKLWIDALRVLAWPLLISCLVVIYHSPVRAVIESLASKFSEANKVSIGSLSLEVEEKAREAGNPELAREVGALSPAAVEQLMLTPRRGGMGLITTDDFFGKRLYSVPDPKVISALQELERKQFIQFSENLDNFLAKVRSLHRVPFSSSSDHEAYLAVGPHETPADQEFLSEEYSLTKLGLKAADAILKAVSAELGQH